jgi:hypothetical protein
MADLLNSFYSRDSRYSSTGGISSSRAPLQEGLLHLGEWRQNSGAVFACKNVGLFATRPAINYKQHVRLARKVGTPDESSDIDQDLAPTLVTNRIGYTSTAHPPPSTDESFLV